MIVHHLNCGTMCVAARHHSFIAEAAPMRGTMVCHCLLIESNAGLVLVETGLGSEDIASPARRLGLPFMMTTRPILDPQQTALAQVRKLGFSERDVRHIVLTHAHLDHAGGIGDFPWAKVHVYAPEQRALTQPSTIQERMAYKRVQFAHGPQWEGHEPSGEHFKGFSAVRPIDELGDEVLLIPLPGHTRGHSAVAVRSSHGWLLHAGDAYYHRSQLELPRGFALPAAGPSVLALFAKVTDWDNGLRLANLARLAQWKRDHGSEVQVFCAHDPVEYQAVRSAAASRKSVNTSQPSLVT